MKIEKAYVIVTLRPDRKNISDIEGIYTDYKLARKEFVYVVLSQTNAYSAREILKAFDKYEQIELPDGYVVALLDENLWDVPWHKFCYRSR